MLGAIIGDIIGSRHEFHPTNNYDFHLFTNRCFFTDDTICTFGVADALVKSESYAESIHSWCQKYPHAGYGGHFYGWVHTANPQPYGSFGNGSAMRVSPIGWWFFTAEEVLEEAKKTAECSHNHPFGIAGAQAVAIAIHDCLKLRRSHHGGSISRDDILNIGLRRAIQFYESDHTKFHLNIEHHRNIFDETCQGTVPVALAIILQSQGFEDAVRRAVSLGADADTLGAIVGSIAEAIWGIPEWIKQKALTYLDPEMLALLKDFRHKLLLRRKKYEEEQEEKMQQHMLLMRWKLGLGNMNDIMLDTPTPSPQKTRTATADMMEITPIPSEDKSICTDWKYGYLSHEQMDILKMGHIPESQEDHWFMYFNPKDMTLHYIRSWTGMEAFTVHLSGYSRGIIIKKVEINRNLATFGVNGDDSAVALLNYLLTAETGLDAETAWKEYLRVWAYTENKYN